ncbi:hypothetical protein POM88_003596 [Heracleum sosnowskyi]|uniref:Uncharacterized protein n=1 Tax=Heracleum sosnowskyi TaxID=360622 RepID=A0AAD8JJX4_9APIA|nr:hypothetical protein POM88_003596 [Heracleum sosnowskyi]
MSQDRKRNTLLSYFPTSTAIPAATPSVNATLIATPTATSASTPTATHVATPSATPAAIATFGATDTPSATRIAKEQYPPTEFGNQRRQFQVSCFNTFPWLE